MQIGGPEDVRSTESVGAREVPSRLRLAVISSPRSGNTWLREMVAELYGLEQIPVHFPEHIPWEDLPERCIIQIHWDPEPDFTALLERHDIRVVVIARHLFDGVISYLNYMYYTHQDGLCPGGGACPECGIAGQTPRSRAFQDYVVSDRVAFLFGHSLRWWNRPGVMRLRYEDLVADTETHLRNLVEQIGASPVRPIAEVIEARSIGRMLPDPTVWQYHFWQGRPGLWRSMLPEAEARRFAERHRAFFETIGYPVDPDPTLEPWRADQNWLQLQLNSTRDHLALERAKHRRRIDESKELRQQISDLRREAAEQEAAYGSAHAELLRYRQGYLDATEQLLGKQRELVATSGRLDALYQRHEETYQQLDRTYHELQSASQSLQALREALEATSQALDEAREQLGETRDRLDETRRQLAPLDELGPRGVKWALRAMRMYRKAKSVLTSRAAEPPARTPTPKLLRQARSNPDSERVSA